MYLKDQAEKRVLEQSKIWILKRVGAIKGNWEGAVSGIGKNPEGCDIMEAKRRIFFFKEKRKWWSAVSNVAKVQNYVKGKNYLGILHYLHKSYFSQNGSDKIDL